MKRIKAGILVKLNSNLCGARKGEQGIVVGLDMPLVEVKLKDKSGTHLISRQYLIIL